MSRIFWTRRTNFGPSARIESALTYDSTRSRVLLFGGSSVDRRHGDTWEWDGAFWTQMDDLGPAPRHGAAMAFDSDLNASILFGGKDADTFGDTWKWDGERWTQLSESGPSSRRGHAVAYDSTRKRIVLFGGQRAENSRFNDTWEFDGEDWTQQQDAGPAPRAFHAMAFEAASGRVILFGGLSAAIDAQPLGDTWAWDGREWVQIAEFGPSPRFFAAMASDVAATLLYGGLTSTQAVQQPEHDTWLFDGKRWTQAQDIGPGPLRGAAIAIDSKRSRAVLFGGQHLSTTEQANPAAVPFSGSTWEAPVRRSDTPSSPVGVLSLALPNVVILDQPMTLSVQLTGPAKEDTVVDFSGPMFGRDGSPLFQATIPAGLTRLDVNVFFRQPSAVTITAQVPGTPAVSIQCLVIDPDP